MHFHWMSCALPINFFCRKPKTKGGWDPKSDGRINGKHRTVVHERVCKAYNRRIPDSRPVDLVLYEPVAPGICLSNQYVLARIRDWFSVHSYDRINDYPIPVDPGSEYESGNNIEN